MDRKEVEQLESEVLSSLCKYPDSRNEYLDKVHSTDFTITSHREIHQALVDLVSGGSKVTKDTVTSLVDKGNGMVMKMMVSFIFDALVGRIDKPTFNKFKQTGKRNRLAAVSAYINKNLGVGADPDTLAADIASMMDRLDTTDSVAEAAGMDVTVDKTLEMIDSWASGVTPYKTYIPEIDRHLFLNKMSGYTVIAGEEGGCKTGLTLWIAKTNARVNNTPTAIFSLEMTKDQLCYRMAMEDPKMAGKDVTEANLKSPQFVSDLKYAIERTRKLPIIIIDNVTNIFHIKGIARKLQLSAQCHTAVLDYMQLADTDPKHNDVTRVSTVSKVLKNMTQPDIRRQLPGMTWIALAQYSDVAITSNKHWNSKNTNNNGSQKKQIKQLRWSRQIKMDCDALLHLLLNDRRSGNDNEVGIDIYCEKQRMGRDKWEESIVFNTMTQTVHSDMLNTKRASFGAEGSNNRPREVKL